MKPFIQKLPLTEETSFVARTYRTPSFEVSWHQHPEYELILFTEGKGMSFIGNHIGEFETGDVFFLGANLPHTFQKEHSDLITSAIVVQFKEDFWGNNFLRLPESKEIRQLFDISMQGMRIEGKSKRLLRHIIVSLEYTSGFNRIIKLCECLQIMAKNRDYILLSTQKGKEYSHKNKERIEKVFHYTMESFSEPIALKDVANLINMSVPSFCNYFKRSTQKTYVGFLNEVRIGHACRLLADTEMTIIEICFESGFNTLANFNKQFLKIRKMTPSQYRKYSRSY